MSMRDSTKSRDIANNIWMQLGLLTLVAVVLIVVAWRYVW